MSDAVDRADGTQRHTCCAVLSIRAHHKHDSTLNVQLTRQSTRQTKLLQTTSSSSDEVNLLMAACKAHMTPHSPLNVTFQYNFINLSVKLSSEVLKGGGATVL